MNIEVTVSISPFKTNWNIYDHPYHILSFLSRLCSSSPSVVWQVSTRRMAMVYPNKKVCKRFKHSAGLGMDPSRLRLWTGTDWDPFMSPESVQLEGRVIFGGQGGSTGGGDTGRWNTYISLHLCWWLRNPATRLSSCYGQQRLNPPFLYFLHDFFRKTCWLCLWLVCCKLLRKFPFSVQTVHIPPVIRVVFKLLRNGTASVLFFLRVRIGHDRTQFHSDWNFSSLRNFREGKCLMQWKHTRILVSRKRPAFYHVKMLLGCSEMWWWWTLQNIGRPSTMHLVVLSSTTIFPMGA